MTKPKLIEAIVKETGVDASTPLNENQTIFDYLNDQTVTYLKKLLVVINALPS